MKYPGLKAAVLPVAAVLLTAPVADAGQNLKTSGRADNQAMGLYPDSDKGTAPSSQGVRLAQESSCTIICKKKVGGVCVESVKVCQPQGGVRGEKENKKEKK